MAGRVMDSLLIILFVELATKAAFCNIPGVSGQSHLWSMTQQINTNMNKINYLPTVLSVSNKIYLSSFVVNVQVKGVF